MSSKLYEIDEFDLVYRFDDENKRYFLNLCFQRPGVVSFFRVPDIDKFLETITKSLLNSKEELTKLNYPERTKRPRNFEKSNGGYR